MLHTLTQIFCFSTNIDDVVCLFLNKSDCGKVCMMYERGDYQTCSVQNLRIRRFTFWASMLRWFIGCLRKNFDVFPTKVCARLLVNASERLRIPLKSVQ